MNKQMTVEHSLLYIYIATCFDLASSSSGKRQNILKKEYTYVICWKFGPISYTILSQLLHFFFIYSKTFFNVWKDKKIKFVRLLKLEVGYVSGVCGVGKYHLLFFGTLRRRGGGRCGVCLKQYIWEISNHWD
jgi:hypothetical protein